MDQVLAKWDALQKAWNGNKLDKVGPILDEIKIALTVVSASFLPLATSSASGKDEQQVWSLRHSIELSVLKFLKNLLSFVVLVALTDKFNALFHYGNFPVG